LITKRQQLTLQFVKEFIVQHSYAPTVTEIAAGIGLASRGVVHRYLKALAAAGEIHLTPKRHRNIRLVCRDPARTLHVKGSIKKDRAIEAVLDTDYIDIGSVFIGEDRFALRVVGDFMLDQGITGGDIVICERVNSVRSGQNVVVSIDGCYTAIRTWHAELSDLVSLHPPKRRHEKLKYAINRLQVHGLYMGLVRYGEAKP
jgi:repressor LexA